jgi:LysR family transcriptional regulator for metE and metH
MHSEGSDARPLHLDLRHLRLVAAMADSGGQTRAAKRLNLTQSALSHQLRELESRIGTPLFIALVRRKRIAQL